MKTQPIKNLDALMGGAVAEQLNDEIQKVAANIKDPNTDAKASRKAVLELIFKSNEARDLVEITSKCKAVLAPPRGVSNSAYIGKDEQGNVVLEEVTDDLPGTMDIFTGEVIEQKTVVFPTQKVK